MSGELVGRKEIQHNTREQAKGYLEDALAIVAELEIDDELKGLAFTKAVDLIAAKQVMLEPVTPTGVRLLGRG